MAHPKKLFLLLLVGCLMLMAAAQVSARSHHAGQAQAPLQCVAFSPYVGNINPDYGPPPSAALIDKLLDSLVKHTPFRCIMTYGVLNGLDHTFAAAKARKMKVVAILWIDKDSAVNSQSISEGIKQAKAYPDTIIKLSCGSEVRTRHGYAYDGEISRCLSSLRQAGIKQPLTTIDTWWEWCNRTMPCGKTSFAAQVDWIGINVFPWWESVHSSLHTCIPAEKAADFHIARMAEVQRTYPGKTVAMTEFGWPSGPEAYIGVNKNTRERCAVAGKKNQAKVLQATFNKLIQKGWSGTAFEAFTENWKPASEGNVGQYWGLCQGAPPYNCIPPLMITGKKTSVSR